MQTAEQLRWVTLDLFDPLKKDNVIYAEIRFAPLLHITKGLSATEVVEIVNEAVKEGIKNTGIEAGIILCTLRHFTSAQSMETLALVEHFKAHDCVGFGYVLKFVLPVTYKRMWWMLSEIIRQTAFTKPVYR